MSLALLPFVAGAAVAGYAVAVNRLARAVRPADDVVLHEVTTVDGWRLGLAEYGAHNGGPVVFLQHGLAATHRAFDFHPHGPSPARALAARGYRVFAGNLRGRPFGDGIHTGRAATWTLSDYLLRDLPALVGFIHGRAGRPVHWIGHSMGGILGLAYTAHFGGGQVATLTTLGSALHYGIGGSVFAKLHRLHPLLRSFRRIPWRLVQRWNGPLGALGISPDGMQYNRRNISGRTAAMLSAHVYVDLTVAELLELATTFDGGEGIHCRDLDCRLPQLAARIPVPWLSIAGAADGQCPPETARWTFERIDAPRREFLLAGRAQGFGADYGHFDLVCGRRADEEIWAPVRRFIEAAEPKAAAAGRF